MRHPTASIRDVATAWPLTGRAEELGLIGALAQRRDGACGVVVAGPQGVGKTRLARAAVAEAERRGMATRWVVATASAQKLPLGAFAAVVGTVGRDLTWLVRHARQAVLSDAGDRTVVLGVDDAHLLDAVSATVVHQLVLRREAIVVLTLRSGEQAPDAVTGLWKDGHLQRLELGPLSADQTASLLREALGGPVSSAAARELWRITGGNALFLRHLVEGELAAGRLERTSGVWRWAGGPALSPSLAELVDARIGRLSDAQREVVEVLALSEPVSVPLLARLVDLDAVEQAEASGLILIRSDGTQLHARLAHPLYGELERARCGQLRSRRLRGRIAVALGAAGGRSAADVIRRAALTLDSDIEPDAQLLTLAAEHAAQLSDPVLAERLARAAAAAGGGFDAQSALCHALITSGGLAEAPDALAALSALAVTDQQVAVAANMRAATLFWALARHAEAEAVLTEAMDGIREPLHWLLVLSLRSVMDAVLARPHAAVAAAQTVLANGQDTHPMARTLAGWGLGTACGGLGRLDGLDGTLHQVEAMTSEFEPGYFRIAGIGNAWTRALRLAGELFDAERLARGYVDRFQDAGGYARPVSAAVYGLVARPRPGADC